MPAYELVTDTDKTIGITVTDFAEDLNDASEIEYVISTVPSPIVKKLSDNDGSINVLAADKFAVVFTPSDTAGLKGGLRGHMARVTVNGVRTGFQFDDDLEQKSDKVSVIKSLFPA